MMRNNLLSGVALVAVAAGVPAAQAQTAQPATPAQAATAGAQGAATDATAAAAEQSGPVGSAQTREPSGTASSDQPGSGLEEIVVTATRRTVNLQRVSATVEAVPASTLKALNVTGVLQLPSLVSGLAITTSGGNSLFLRGIGSASNGFNEAQTAVYIDGLYLANPATGIYSFNNVERIEVLKGPQGTLYGRNVTGGLISVTTRDPAFDKSRVDASVGVENYDTVSANLYASTPVTDNLSAGIAFFHRKQSQGWSVNLFNGHDAQKSDETGVQTKLKWQPNDGLKITGTFIYNYNNRDLGLANETYPGSIGSDGTPFYGKYRFASRIDASAPTNIYIGTLKIEQDLGFANLMSITGYQTSTANLGFESGLSILGQPVAAIGGIPQVASYAQFFEHNKTFSQEFQLTSKQSSSRFDWVAGAFYYDDHTELQLDTYFTCVANVCGPGTPTRNDGYPNTLSGSVYGDGTYRFFKATRLTVGLRYTNERKTLSGMLYPLPGYPDSVAVIPGSTVAAPAPAAVLYPGQPYTVGGVVQPGIPTKLHFEKLTYRFVLAQDIGDDIHLYASHNLGFKSGAFNGNGFTNPPVQPELLYATEAGLKSELFDRRLRLNLAYFHYTYKGVQLRSAAPPALPGNTILINAASERLDGVDGDFSIVATRALTINGSFEWLNGKYVNFPGATITAPRRDANGNVLNGVTTLLNQNLAGFTVPNAAPFSASIGATYRLQTQAGVFSLSANDHYNTPYTIVADNSIRQKRHHTIDASLNWIAPNDHYDVNLFVRNLTNQYIYAQGQVGTTLAIVPAAPRTYGLSVGFHY